MKHFTDLEGIYKNLDDVISNIQNDFDYCLAITGRKRRGKSTLAYHIAEYMSKKLGSKVWLCYDYAHLREAYTKAGQYDIIFGDETIGFLQSAKWNTPDAKEFIELFDRIGYKNLTTILIMPEFESLQKSFREARIDCHLDLTERGKVNVYRVYETPIRSYFNHRKPSFTDTFPPLPADKEIEYRKVKEDSMVERLKDLNENGNDIRGRLLRVNTRLRDILGITQVERADAFEVDERTIQRWDASTATRQPDNE